MKIHTVTVLLLGTISLVGACASYVPNATTAEGNENYPNIRARLAVADSCIWAENCVAIEISIRNHFKRAMCLQSYNFPLDGKPTPDIFEIKTASGESVPFTGLTPIIMANFESGEANMVISPGKIAVISVSLSDDFNLLPERRYFVEYSASAIFCDLYNSGNPSELYQERSKFVEKQSVRVSSNILEFVGI